MSLGPNDLSLFLQRAEVRLSTQQRVAGAFLSGAGLLLLLPVLFKDAAIGILVNIAYFWHAGYWYSASCLFISLFFSIFISIYALWLLVRDLIKFYFVGNYPEYQHQLADDRTELRRIRKLVEGSGRGKDLHDFSLELLCAIDELIKYIEKTGEENSDRDDLSKLRAEAKALGDGWIGCIATSVAG